MEPEKIKTITIDETDTDNQQLKDTVSLLMSTFELNKVSFDMGMSAMLNTFCDFCHRRGIDKEEFMDICESIFEVTDPDNQE